MTQREGKEGQFFHLLVTRGGVVPGLSQEPGKPSQSPMQVAGVRVLGSSAPAF